MRRFFPVQDLARDERFTRASMAELQNDPRSTRRRSADAPPARSNRLSPARPDASDSARRLMHGIFVGEVQALEGAGRTCWDFTTGDDAPLALKLDMGPAGLGRGPHVEISCKLGEWMGQ